MSEKLIHLKVNGKLHAVAVAPQRTLLEVLREQLGFTGTKRACRVGDLWRLYGHHRWEGDLIMLNPSARGGGKGDSDYRSFRRW